MNNIIILQIMNKLPVEMIEHIVQYLSLFTRTQFGFCSKKFYQIINSNPFYCYCRKHYMGSHDELFVNLFFDLKWTKDFLRLYAYSLKLSYCFYKACEQDNRDVVKYIVESGTVNGAKSFVWLCSHGYLDLAKYMIQIGPPLDIQHKAVIFRKVCKCGQMDIAKWIHTQNPSLSREVYLQCYFLALNYGHKKMAKWILNICLN